MFRVTADLRAMEMLYATRIFCVTGDLGAHQLVELLKTLLSLLVFRAHIVY